MRPDTVSAAVAAHYGLSKAELLDRDAAGEQVLDDLPLAQIVTAALPCH